MKYRNIHSKSLESPEKMTTIEQPFEEMKIKLGDNELLLAHHKAEIGLKKTKVLQIKW